MLDRPTVALLVLAAFVAAPACKKKNDAEGKSSAATKSDDDGAKKKSKAKKGDDEEPTAEEESKPKAKGGKGCKIPKDLKADFTVGGDCKVVVKENIKLEDGATLTVEKGAKLSFEAGIHLWVDYGKIVAKGTEDEPIVFTSANSSPSAGDWEGIVFESKTTAGNVFDHVTIEYAGHASWTHGAIGFYGDVNPGRVSITNSTIQHNSKSGIWNDKPKSTFAKLEGNVFKDNGGVSLDLDAAVMGSVGENTFAEPIKIKGTIHKSQKWPKLKVPVLVEGNLVIHGEGEAAMVTLADKTTIKLAHGNHVWLGNGDGGGFIGKGTVFTSTNASAASGDWDGLIIGRKATAKLEDCVVEYAGGGGHGHAAVTFYDEPAKKMKNVKFANCTFRHNEHAAFSSSDHDCGGFEEGNKSEGVPICRKAD